MDFQHFIIDWMGYIIFFIFILLFLGIIQKEPMYFIEIIFIFKLFLALYLILRFNDFRTNIKFTLLDRKICFYSGIYLLLFAIADLIQEYTIKIKAFLKPYLPWIK
jgi:hypothetical protein